MNGRRWGHHPARLMLLAGLLAAVPAAGAAERRVGQGSRASGGPILVAVANTQETGTRYWIGVQMVPLSEALKSQLRLESGMLVERVVPESPAAKAGIQRHDILLKFGDRQIQGWQDLVDAVAQAKTNQVTVQLLRGGRKQTVKVTPTKLSREQQLKLLRPRELEQDWLRLWVPDLRKGEAARYRIFGPAFALPGRLDLPPNTSVTISKKGDAPAKITVKKDGKTWEVAEDKLDELPKDVRPFVERLLRGGWSAQIDLRGLDSRQWLKEFPAGPDAAKLRERMERWLREMPGGVSVPEVPFRYRGRIERQLDQMQRELKKLREQVDQLHGRRGTKKPVDQKIELAPND